MALQTYEVYLVNELQNLLRPDENQSAKNWYCVLEGKLRNNKFNQISSNE